MGYTHRMEADIRFRPGVSFDQMREALRPIFEYWGVEMKESENQFRSSDEESEEEDFAYEYEIFHAGINDQPCFHVFIESEGYIGWNYDDLIKDCGNNLTGLCEPALFTLVNLDESIDRFNMANPAENIIDHIWAGDPEEVRAAKRVWAWERAEAILRENGFKETELEQLRGAKSVIEAQELEEGNMEEGNSILRRPTPAP